MKVIEKGKDRTAEVHIHVEGKVDALGEWGEYIDATDKAICCYVPVEEGHKVKIGGKFTGTTLVVAYDAIVDGVLRKASSYVAKTVHLQKNKKIDFETFLYKAGQDTIDTDMLVAPISGVTVARGEGMETIGTMELRLYVTRQLDVTHTPGRFEKYDSASGSIEDDEEPQSASYKMIAPTFQMSFERNSAALDRLKLGRELRKINSKRPGTEPWAIFRFHYRTKEAILENKLTLTYDPNSRAKIDGHTLNFEPVPTPPAGTKPHKEDGDSSTRASSPTPDVPSTPIKGALKGANAKSSTLPKRKPPKPTITPASIPKMTSTTKKELVRHPETTTGPELQDGLDDSLRARVFSKQSPAPPSTETSFTPISKAATNGDGDSVASTSTVNSDIAKAIADTVKDADTTVNAAKETEADPAKNGDEFLDKTVEKEQPVVSDTIAVHLPKSKPISTTGDSAAKPSSTPQVVAELADGTVNKSATAATALPKKEPQVAISPTNKPLVASTPAVPVTPTTQKRAAAFATVTPENKVTFGMINGTTSQSKRPKFIPKPASTSATTIVPRIPSTTLSPRPMSIERKVSEQRKKLEAMRRKRLEMAKKQEELDRKMEPYNKCMAEELERLNREMMEEEAAAAEDEEHLMASEEMLKEFEMAE